MPYDVKMFTAEYGEAVTGGTDDDEWFGYEKPGPDGLVWVSRGAWTDSFPEAEARAILLAKTFKNVRIVSRTTEVVGHVEGE